VINGGIKLVNNFHPGKIRNQVILGSNSPNPLKIPNPLSGTKLKNKTKQNNGMVGNGEKRKIINRNC
jgi:hypothetical protein